MTNEELKLLRLIQALLVRNYVDTQKLDVQVIGSSVYLEGEFKTFEYTTAKKDQDKIEQELGVKRGLLHVERQIRSLGEITHIEFKLTNWERRGSQWFPKRG